MTRAATVLCPGPSLARWSQLPACDVTIAVNRAVLHSIKCDWWAFTDDRIYATYKPQHSPRIFTTEETQRRLGISADATYESFMASFPHTGIGWTCYTMTAAMVLAASFRTKLVRIYGCDWSGEFDFDGHKYPWHETDSPMQRRVDARWNQEKQIFVRVRDMLASRGVVTELHGLA